MRQGTEQSLCLSSRPLNSPHLVPTSPKTPNQHPSLHAERCSKNQPFSSPFSQPFANLLDLGARTNPNIPPCKSLTGGQSCVPPNANTAEMQWGCWEQLRPARASPSLGTNAEHLPVIYPFLAMRWH